MTTINHNSGPCYRTHPPEIAPNTPNTAVKISGPSQKTPRRYAPITKSFDNSEPDFPTAGARFAGAFDCPQLAPPMENSPCLTLNSSVFPRGIVAALRLIDFRTKGGYP